MIDDRLKQFDVQLFVVEHIRVLGNLRLVIDDLLEDAEELIECLSNNELCNVIVNDGLLS